MYVVEILKIWHSTLNHKWNSWKNKRNNDLPICLGTYINLICKIFKKNKNVKIFRNIFKQFDIRKKCIVRGIHTPGFKPRTHYEKRERHSRKWKDKSYVLVQQFIVYCSLKLLLTDIKSLQKKFPCLSTYFKTECIRETITRW